MTASILARRKILTLLEQADTLLNGIAPAVKTIGGTVIKYANDLDNIVYDAFNHRITAVDMRRAHKELMRQLAPEVVTEGLHEGGLADEDIDEEDQAWVDETISDWLGVQVDAANGFAADAYAAGDDGDKRADCLSRESMWVDALRDLGELAKAYAMRSTKAIWVLGLTNTHTPDCVALSQKKAHRLSWWIDNGYTPPIHLGCMCSLVNAASGETIMGE